MGTAGRNLVTITAPPTRADQVTPGRRAGRGTDRAFWPILAVAPFFLFIAIFLIVPIAVTMVTSISDGEGGFTLASIRQLFEPQYASAFVNTARLSLVTTIVGGVLGMILAWALASIERPRWLRSLMLSFTVVASQQGGVPIAFAFIATIGTQGLLSVFLRNSFGVELPALIGIGTFNGLVVVYTYFQAPLMAVLMLPAMAGVRQEWRESAQSLGAGRVRYLVDVVLPILAPSVAGAALLLFANAFAAYATAYALAGSGANLVPILIGFFIRGNVLSDPALAAALVTGMIFIIAVAMIGRSLLIRRATRWLR